MLKRARTVLATLIAGVLVLSLLGLAPSARNDDQKTSITGGGQGSFGADLDHDGQIDGSYFALGVVLRGHSADGHFVCAMWGNTHFLGLPLMGVEGVVTSGTVNRDGSVTLQGVGTVDLGSPGNFFTNVPFRVTVKRGGPHAGTIQLSVIGLFDGVPGDSIPGNHNYDLPVETVSSGLILIERRNNEGPD